MSSPLFVLAASFASFAVMHAVVLLATAWLARALGAAPVRLSLDAGGLFLAFQFVGAEAVFLSLALCFGLVPLSPTSVQNALLVPAVSLAFWEVWFYLGHRLLHTRGMYILHRAHHALEGVHPSLSFGAGETALLSAGFYLPLAVASHLPGGVSVATFAITFTVAYALNVASHLEDNLLGDAHDHGMLRHFLNSARYHRAHHRGARGNFALVSPWLDRLFSTEITLGQAQRATTRTPPRARRRAESSASPPLREA
jgi:sterol desaturase/sphingolipid hydroxylase (fatty acid hydroxylase superfamily)